MQGNFCRKFGAHFVIDRERKLGDGLENGTFPRALVANNNKLQRSANSECGIELRIRHTCGKSTYLEAPKAWRSSMNWSLLSVSSFPRPPIASCVSVMYSPIVLVAVSIDGERVKKSTEHMINVVLERWMLELVGQGIVFICGLEGFYIQTHFLLYEALRVAVREPKLSNPFPTCVCLLPCTETCYLTQTPEKYPSQVSS